MAALENGAQALHAPATFTPAHWLRDGGRHGGGTRMVAPGGGIFDRGSVNVSQVHYDDLPERRLASATALSTIIHPDHPLAPSVHMHVSWTEMRDGHGYWRVMADLNPSIEDPEQTAAFAAALRGAAGEHYDLARAQGDAYFEVPALGRRRGVTHFYLEGLATEDPDADRVLARTAIEAGIDTYARLMVEAQAGQPAATEAQREAQLAYHTLYLFQVLTLDRGTTSGLLVHADNDVGTLGSLPSRVDRQLLASWASKVPPVQAPLVSALAAALPDRHPAPVENPQKTALARVAREHYTAHPEALKHQAPTPVRPAGRGHT